MGKLEKKTLRKMAVCSGTEMIMLLLVHTTRICIMRMILNSLHSAVLLNAETSLKKTQLKTFNKQKSMSFFILKIKVLSAVFVKTNSVFPIH